MVSGVEKMISKYELVLIYSGESSVGLALRIIILEN